MSPRSQRAISCALGALALVGATTLASSPASAAPAAPAETCTIEGATLTWGFKESFRAYIDGSIANGEWTTSGGASYATPEFTWSDGVATVDSDAGLTEVAFTGSVRFTGHDGLLDTTIADPIVQLHDDGSVTVLLDVSGPTMEGDPIEVDSAPFVDGGVDSETSTADAHTFTITTELTDEGSTAFPNYEATTPFDPATLTVPATDDCPLAIEAPTASAEPSAPATDDASSNDELPVWVWVAAGLGVIAAGVAVGAVALRRRKGGPDA